MTAAAVDFTVANNETWDLGFVLKDASGALVNLTGRTIKMQLRDPAAPANIVVELSTDNERIVIADAPAGVWALAVPVSVAQGVPNGSYVYDVIDYLANDPRVWRRQKGTVTVEWGVTKR
ncbi:hypothetical protein M2322_003551 [Rhodoblastus acidophilus]|uniref:hypothetical protein n=1 Tax=Rhodoblastus acidophilus TaxID=1074 RepID=UPI002224ED62|nr:hypothetical protein [Rhodoblastus acidophilus]MCW2317986.1 hypothetical protein [Rhodoblastus acidophilus]